MCAADAVYRSTHVQTRSERRKERAALFNEVARPVMPCQCVATSTGSEVATQRAAAGS